MIQTVAFSTDANPTQHKYGKNNQPAGFDILKKDTIVAAMKTKSMRIVTSAKKISCIPKKMIDQDRLRRSWTEKRKNPCFTAGT